MEIIAKEATRVASLSSFNEENKYIPIVIGNDGQSFTIINNGTAPAPCIVTIIPKNDIMLLTIEGLSKEKIEVQKIQKGQILIIDSVNRNVTINGTNAFEFYNAWEFPYLKPGSNNIKITNADLMSLSIEYQPRYI